MLDSLQIMPTLPCWPSVHLPEHVRKFASWCSFGCSPTLSGHLSTCPHAVCVSSQYYCSTFAGVVLGVITCKPPSLFQSLLQLQLQQFQMLSEQAYTMCNLGCQLGIQLKNDSGMRSSLMLIMHLLWSENSSRSGL